MMNKYKKSSSLDTIQSQRGVRTLSPRGPKMSKFSSQTKRAIFRSFISKLRIKQTMWVSSKLIFILEIKTMNF